MVSAATPQYEWIVNTYKKFLPLTTFPYIPLVCAACFQVFAWFGGSFLGPFSLIPRVFILWLFAFGEYSIMSPSMSSSVEILNMPEPNLVVAYQVITLVVFTALSTLVFKNPFQWKYLVSYIFLAIAVYIAFVW